MSAEFGKYAQLFDLAGQTTTSLQKQNGEAMTMIFVPGSSGWAAPAVDTEWVVPKELEMFWTVMGGAARGASSSSTQSLSDSLNQAYEAGAQQRRDEAEVRQRNESYQRDLMDKKCGLSRLC